MVTYLAESEGDYAPEPEANATESSTVAFALDSGATDHMCKDQSLFSEFVNFKSPESVYLAEEQIMCECVGIGTILTKSVRLENVRFVPKLRRNLLCQFYA